MKLRIEAGGYKFLQALDGEDGYNKVMKEKPDLILLDIVLPKINGLTLCKNLKADAKTKYIPIMVVSAYGGKDLPQRSFAAGADEFISKPFDAKELLKKIHKLLKD